jgi:hypothetical protein
MVHVAIVSQRDAASTSPSMFPRASAKSLLGSDWRTGGGTGFPPRLGRPCHA